MHRRLTLLIALALAACPAARNAVVEDSGAARDSDGIRDSDARETGPDAEVAPEPDPAFWRRQVIYLAMPDRFCNGDTHNDRRGAAGCFDPDHPRRFHGGDLAGLRQRLGYLEELGVTALWLTPLYQQVGLVGSACGYHGYWPDLAVPDDGAMEPRLGTPAELDALIADLEARGLRLIFDLIVNHAGYGARVTESHPDWFHPGEGCEELGSEEIYCSLAGLPDFAQENPEVAAYLIGSSSSWVERYPVAGIRMDTAKHVPLSFLADQWIPAVRRTRPGMFLIAEVFSGDSPALYEPFLEAGFDGAFNFALHGALVETFARGGSVDHLADRITQTISALGPERALLMVNLLDNHDMPRFITEAARDLPRDGLARRYHLALTALMTLPGIPQIYAGDELGMLGEFPDNRRDMPDWAWDPEERGGAPEGYLPEPAEHFRLTARLIALRRQQAALSEGSYCELRRQRGGVRPNLFAFYRGADDSRVVVALNNGDEPTGPVSLPIQDNPGITPGDRAALPDGTALEDRLDQGAPATVTIREGRLTLDLPPLTAGVYVVRGGD